MLYLYCMSLVMMVVTPSEPIVLSGMGHLRASRYARNVLNMIKLSFMGDVSIAIAYGVNM